MSKKRMIDTRFWIDDYISNLDPSEKLLFLYFLTNPYTDICGVYEIPLKHVALESGLDREMVLKILDRFSRDGKIFYENGWVAIKNFTKHQQKNPKVEIGISIGLSKAPKILLERVHKDYDTLSHLNLNLNSNSKIATKVADSPKPIKLQKKDEPMNLQEFILWTSKSPNRHIQIIGDWADTTQPSFSTKDQWSVFIKRNLRAAKDLVPFTQKQLVEAYTEIQKANGEGWLKKATLETLIKFLK